MSEVENLFLFKCYLYFLWINLLIFFVGFSVGLLDFLFYELFILFLAVPHGLRDLSSLTRDWTRAPGSESAES